MSESAPPGPAASDAASSADAARGLSAAIRRSGLDATGRSGEPATSIEYRVDAEGTVRRLGLVLAQLHRTELNAAELGAVLGPLELVERARRSVERPLADRPPRSASYRHVDDPRLVAILEGGASRVAQRSTRTALTHGRPTLGTLWCFRGDALGLLGWAEAAIGDPHRDLAVAAGSIAAEFTPMLVPAFVDAYALFSPDVVAMDWYALAAELTR